jgi:hypothetical protein
VRQEEISRRVRLTVARVEIHFPEHEGACFFVVPGLEVADFAADTAASLALEHAADSPVYIARGRWNAGEGC